MSANVLVTGGAGFIGSHLVELLCDRGYGVTVLDNLSQGKAEWVDTRADLVEGDVTDINTMRNIIYRGEGGVFHLAAMSRVLPSVGTGPAGALFSADQNIKGTLNTLVAAAEWGVKKFVYSASSTYYGLTPAPHFETMPFSGSTPYAVSKYAGELYALQFDRQYNLPCVCLKYFQVYGPRCPSSGAYAMVSSIFVGQRKRGEPLTIDGDGTQRRDFVHVKDVALANLMALQTEARGVSVNIGTGISHSVKELADLISPNQIFRAPRPLDMKETLADTSLCRQIFGWVPETNFYVGTQDLLDLEG